MAGVVAAFTAAGVAAGTVVHAAIMGVINTLGFTSAGIAAGSTAAGMMAAEAVATGGAIAAGGTVATLQSIGVIGLGVTAGPVIGAVVGAAVGIIYYFFAAEAVATGGAIAAGGTVATLESIGVIGLGATAGPIIGVVVGAAVVMAAGMMATEAVATGGAIAEFQVEHGGCDFFKRIRQTITSLL